MKPITIALAFEQWVEEVMVKAFDKMHIQVTSTAQQGIAYLLQAQLNEQTVRTPSEVIESADALLQKILTLQYRTPILTINRALHLITHANEVVSAFPCTKTMELGEATPRYANPVVDPEKAGT